MTAKNKKKWKQKEILDIEIWLKQGFYNFFFSCWPNSTAWKQFCMLKMCLTIVFSRTKNKKCIQIFVVYIANLLTLSPIAVLYKRFCWLWNDLIQLFHSFGTFCKRRNEVHVSRSCCHSHQWADIWTLFGELDCLLDEPKAMVLLQSAVSW